MRRSRPPARRDHPFWWIVGLGIGSLVVLVAGASILDARVGTVFEAFEAVSGMQAGAATVHLWLEERLSGDEVETERVAAPLRNLRSTWSRLRDLLGETASLRRRVEEVDFQLDRFERLTGERLAGLEEGSEVGIGSRADRAYDSAFEELGVALSGLRVHLDDELLAVRRSARLGLRSLVACWLLLVGSAGLHLFRRGRAQRRAELELAASHDRFLASQKMEAVGRLAGGVAHDINNYLAGINAQCELVLRRSGDEKTAARMRTVIATVFRASALIQQLLAFSRRQPAAPRVVDLDRVIERLEPMVVQLVGAGVRLRTELGGPAPVRIDPVRLEQVLLNLVVNARDAMPGGGEIRVETRRESGRCVLTIEDDGCGIPPEVQDRIWEPFYTTRSGSGASGLGLSTVLGIVEQSGGSVAVESPPGQGARFRIDWPESDLEIEEGVDHGRASDRPAEQGTEGGDEAILLVEDNRELRTATVALLRSQGYRVEAAESGEEAMERLRDRAAPDLVIADIVLPGIDGRRMADLLRERFPATAVLFVTGYSADPELRRRVREGEAPLLEKPFTSQALLRRVREVLDARTAADSPGSTPPGPSREGRTSSRGDPSETPPIESGRP